MGYGGVFVFDLWGLYTAVFVQVDGKPFDKPGGL
jgi:hypothetical protein